MSSAGSERRHATDPDPIPSRRHRTGAWARRLRRSLPNTKSVHAVSSPPVSPSPPRFLNRPAAAAAAAAMAKLTSELLRPVDPAAALDEAALLRYLAANVPGFPGPAPALSLTQFGHGQSNPTYCIHAYASAPGGGPATRYVLRKKPPGSILQSAHAVEREYQVRSGFIPISSAPLRSSSAAWSRFRTPCASKTTRIRCASGCELVLGSRFTHRCRKLGSEQ